MKTVPFAFLSNVLQNAHRVEQNDAVAMKTADTEVKSETLANAFQVNNGNTDIAKDSLDDTCSQRPAGDSVASSTPTCLVKQENVIADKDIDQPKQENTSALSESTSGSKSGKPKIKGVSMMELFTPEQVREPIKGLREWIDQVLGNMKDPLSLMLCTVVKNLRGLGYMIKVQ